MKSIKTLLLTTTAVLACTLNSNALFMTVSDGTVAGTVVVLDESPGDVFPGLGTVTFAGSIGVWNVVVNTGISKPISGSATAPEMDLNFVVHSTGPGSLLISLGDSGFTYTGNMVNHWGGTTVGTVENYLYDGNDLVSSLTGSGPVFGGSASGQVDLQPGEVMTLSVRITHTGAGTTSGDQNVSVPDGGTTVMLLGMALSGFALLRRKLA